MMDVLLYGAAAVLGLILVAIAIAIYKMENRSFPKMITMFTLFGIGVAFFNTALQEVLSHLHWS